MIGDFGFIGKFHYLKLFRLLEKIPSSGTDTTGITPSRNIFKIMFQYLNRDLNII